MSLISKNTIPKTSIHKNTDTNPPKNTSISANTLNSKPLPKTFIAAGNRLLDAAKQLRDKLFRDPRHFQIAYLSSFLLYGVFFLDWNSDLRYFMTAFLACTLTQIVATYFTTKNYQSIKSGLISALALCLLFKANAVGTFALAGILAISSKFLIRYKGKHIFNPANFGIIAAIILTGDAWISPGQWGNSIILLFVLGVLGTFILLRVGRIDTSLSFIITFASLEFCRSVLYQGWGLDYFVHQMSSGALLLFTFFMITDPVTTPNSPKARIIWAAFIGVVTFLLANFMQVHTAPLWALFFIAPITTILDRKFIHPKFNWK